MDFKSITIGEYCPTLNYNFKIKNVRDTHLIEILVISFHGTYRDGSGGSPDAGLIKGIVTAGLSVFNPFLLLIDLSDLEYNWGDNLDLSFEETQSTKTVVLVSEKCRRAISTLFFGIDTKKDIVDNDFFFDNFDKAIDKLKSKSSW